MSSEYRYGLPALSGRATSGVPATAHSLPPSRRNDLSWTAPDERANSTLMCPLVSSQPVGDLVMDTSPVAKVATQHARQAVSRNALMRQSSIIWRLMLGRATPRESDRAFVGRNDKNWTAGDETRLGNEPRQVWLHGRENLE